MCKQPLHHLFVDAFNDLFMRSRGLKIGRLGAITSRARQELRFPSLLCYYEYKFMFIL
jgi:hypothetical protein